MKCVGFKSLQRGNMLGFADLQMDNGVVVRGCTYHESSGKRWCSPPARPMLDGDRKLVIELGKIVYMPVIDFVDREIRHQWSASAAKAIAAYLESTKPAGTGPMSSYGVTPKAGDHE